MTHDLVRRAAEIKNFQIASCNTNVPHNNITTKTRRGNNGHKGGQENGI